MKTILEKIPGDRRHVALPPAPGIDEWLVDPDQAHPEGSHHDKKHQPFAARHVSRLDKPPG
jgi:hypothetical protein